MPQTRIGLVKVTAGSTVLAASSAILTASMSLLLEMLCEVCKCLQSTAHVLNMRDLVS